MRSLEVLDKLTWDGWSLGHETASLLLSRLDALKPKMIVECGSGKTTVLMGQWAKENKARLISLEHEPYHWAITTKLLKDYDLDVDLRLCNLDDTPYGQFYMTKLPKNIDFALIDGPPGHLGRSATLYELYVYGSKRFVAWLDDIYRADESAALQLWARDLGAEIRSINWRIAEVTWT